MILNNSGLSLDQFIQDQPAIVAESDIKLIPANGEQIIHEVRAISLSTNTDERGSLTELLSYRMGPIGSVKHIYNVKTEPGSIRAWVFHKLQWDRLAFTEGSFELVLYDLRPQSPTYGRMNEFQLGKSNKCCLLIPPYIIHGVQNIGMTQASFINMTDQVFNESNPDKYRVPWNDPRIPYNFKKI